ncbi:MAG: hypothetical protein M1820_009414 [Bogoriella megaspora]|nr:MAG: hypothetical protein M1820_009414 [Bogoriella megaspora]
MNTSKVCTNSARLELLMAPLGRTIDVVVSTRQPDDNPKTFHIHERLLRGISPYLDSACKRIWRVSDDDEVPIVVEDMRVFRMFVQWLYSGAFQYHTLPDTDSKCQGSIRMILQFYVLAVRLQVPALKDHILSEMQNIPLADSDFANIKYLYTNTNGPCELREELMKRVASICRGVRANRYFQDGWAENAQSCPEFFFDLANKLNCG